MIKQEINSSDSSAVMKKVQEVQLEILLEFDRICKENNIKYQLYAGTLLGAIRHDGFIPWDDDVDVCMLREEYDKFLAIADKCLDNKYIVQNYETEENFPFQFTKLRKKQTLYSEMALDDLDIHQGIFIDIFPYDNIRPDKLSGKVQRILLNSFRTINSCRSKERNLKAPNIINRYGRMLVYYLLKIIPKKKMDRFITKLSCMFNKEETKYVGELNLAVTKDFYRRFSFRRSVFYDSIDWQFEGYKFPIPKEYDYVLTKNYGDYMTPPPVDQQKPHHELTNIVFDTREKNISKQI